MTKVLVATRECAKCHVKKPLSEFSPCKKGPGGLYSYCRPCAADHARAMHRKRSQNPDWVASERRRKTEELRQRQREAIEHYGGRCACCGETEPVFLALDHIDGGGNEHRRLINTRLCRWLKRNGWPDGFQVLCFNCNWAKARLGQCPHQAGRAAV